MGGFSGGLLGDVTINQGGDMQGAYNTGVPGNEIITDDDNGALTIQCGSAADTDNVLEIENKAAELRASIKATGEAAFNSVQFDTNPIAVANADGLLQWNATDETLNLGMSGGDVTQQIGQELFMKVINKSNAVIPNGSAVYVSGRQGGFPEVSLAQGNAEATSAVIGLATQDIADDATGFITIFGFVRGIKTNYTDWAEGLPLYVSTTVPGGLTIVEPDAPHHSDQVGFIGAIGGAGNGSIVVYVQRHKTLEELSDINGTALTTAGQMIVYDPVAGKFDFSEVYGTFKGSISLPKASGTGIKVDGAYGWKDLEGQIVADNSGGDAPTLTAYRGAIREYLFDANDKVDCRFHMPHDWAPGTDLFLHVHWSHNGTAVSGSFACTISASYSKGHSQENFIAPVAHNISVNTVNIATTPQYRHKIDEYQLTAASPAADQFDTDLLEVDGLILVNLTMTGVPTVTGGAAGVFIHFIDLHYQSTETATKNKAPNFYA